MNCGSVDESFDKFNNVILTYLNAHAPLKCMSVKSNSAPWFSNTINAKCTERDKAKSIFNRTRNALDFQIYKKLKNSVNSVISQKSFLLKQFERCKSSVDVWNVMNSLINFRHKKASKICKLLKEDGSEILDNQEICDKLANEFLVKSSQSDVSKMKSAVDNYEVVYLQANPEYKQPEVIPSEVLGAINYVKKGRHDEKLVPKRVFKCYSNVLVKPIAVIFNLIFSLSVIPSVFKYSVCTPLYKSKGSYCESSSYRAIYGLSFIVKVFERILYNRLLGMTEDNFSNFQYGFRAKRSCESAISFLTQSVFDIIDKKNGKSIAVFIDFRKAFDSIDHTVLVDKLLTKFDNKIEPYMIKLLIDYFINRNFSIKN